MDKVIWTDDCDVLILHFSKVIQFTGIEITLSLVDGKNIVA